MSRAVHEFRDPTRFVVGTVGQPGERVFFVQATESGRPAASKATWPHSVPA